MSQKPLAKVENTEKIMTVENTWETKRFHGRQEVALLMRRLDLDVLRAHLLSHRLPGAVCSVRRGPGCPQSLWHVGRQETPVL